MFLGSRSRLRAAVIAAAVGAGVLVAATPAAAAPAAGTRAYLVITAPGATSGAETAVSTNGGTVWTKYDAIGVLVAHSAATDFATKMRTVSGVQKVGATRTSDIPAAAANPPIPAAQPQSTPAAGEPLRADMAQIGADKAWAVNTGSSSVTVGVLDTGVDDLHADLKPNFDAANSASCAYGKLDTRTGSWRANTATSPVSSHGTHVAGTIAAAKNNLGMVGVAPGVKIASVRVSEGAKDFFFPENTICAMVFSGDRGFEVTNNSYYTDPWLFNCPDNADQDAILEGVKRAVAYAEGKGVLNVAAAGNSTYNLANKTSDSTSPNDSTAVQRTVTNACLSIPTEVSGVVSVSSITSANVLSSFSNYGTDKIHITAPGSNVYSTLPGGQYGNLSGTSMASPHVAGVAALLKSTNPTATPAQLRTLLATQADDLSCSDSRCAGTTAKNNFFGEGRVDAHAAVGGTTPGAKEFENAADVAIPDNGAAVTSPITVSGVTGNAPATLKVDVNIVHTYRGDLVVDLVAPDGTAYRLKSSNSDSADNLVATYTVNASGEVANGTWKLQVKDVAAQDVGHINSWKLTF
ncbi:S8 family peptidase [Lentzea flaviverrucosa]|uniref:Proprotein convertase P-domain-containing protein n=1 Tax=Lentzea flaviverrucosa TaxID=200379 RepID=A0A1H9XUN0_9PSEU|nr:S8 family serine peptidase [Lentzea flaviverrucosa]RDI19175.1 proprotein convertase P-domain-containing protein [Lentzea flaviverrucosa]SES49477.1 Proprotein convertase P-domain-containing protein [Lentzea flaviverrucosa]